MIARWRTHVQLGALGLVFGATLSGAGFTDYGEVHRMFTLADVRLVLTFGTAVVLGAIGFAIHCHAAALPSRPLRVGTIPGAIVFGVGWALCGGCPGAVLAMIGEGKLAAFVILAGILAGTAIGKRLTGALRWDSGSCAS